MPGRSRGSRRAPLSRSIFSEEAPIIVGQNDATPAPNRGAEGEVEVSVPLAGALEALDRALRTRATAPEVLQLLDQGVAHLLDEVDAEAGSLLVLDKKTEDLVFVIVRDGVAKDKLQWRRVPCGHGIAGSALAGGAPVLVNETMWDERFFAFFDREFGFKTKNVLAVPLIHEGEKLGVIEAINKRGSALFTAGNVATMRSFCAVAAALLHDLENRGESTVPPDSNNELRRPSGADDVP